jgi:hypothetical protein
MKSADASSHFPVRKLGKGLGILTAVISLLLVTAVSAFASTVNIYDNARVLNSQVQSEAQSLSYPMDIYTITNYTAPNSSFDQAARAKINRNDLIVMAINTTPGHQHVYIKAGPNVPLSNSDSTNAANTFASSYKSGGYNGAAIAAIDSLRSSLNSGSGSGVQQGRGGGLFNFNGALCCVGVLVLLGILFFVIIRRRRSGPGGGFFNRGAPVPPPPPPYNPYGNQPPYGGYNQGYPPNQGGGMNPLAAGGLGAAAGGLLGYELGKNAGENEARREDWNQGQRGGDGGGDFGGGGGADFGGGGGGDFGGGGGGDFGGNDNSGGGGGGSDF